MKTINEGGDMKPLNIKLSEDAIASIMSACSIYEATPEDIINTALSRIADDAWDMYAKEWHKERLDYLIREIKRLNQEYLSLSKGFE